VGFQKYSDSSSSCKSNDFFGAKKAEFNLASDNIQLRNEDPDSDINGGKVEKKPLKPTFGVVGASVPNVTHSEPKDDCAAR
jgi:hypothetical protein